MTPKAVPTGKPESPEQLIKWYGDYVRRLVQRANVPPQEIDDVAQNILTRELEVGVLDMYDPSTISDHNKRPVTFKAFLSSRVSLRIKGQRDSVLRRAGRELLLCDTTDDAGVSWLDQFGGEMWDDYSGVDAEEFVTRMRCYLATVPRRSAQDSCDLLALFDELVRQVRETGEVSSAQVQERFGIADTTATAWVSRLRQIMGGAGDLPQPEKHEVGGITLSLPDIREAIEILQRDKAIMVDGPLRRAGHPLSMAEKGWYHPFSKEERKLYPELEIDPQTHKKPAGHVKLAVLHRLERMLGIAMADAEAVAEVVPAGLAPALPSTAPAESEPDPEPTALELLEARIFRIPGATGADVDEILAMAAGLVTA